MVFPDTGSSPGHDIPCYRKGLKSNVKAVSYSISHAIIKPRYYDNKDLAIGKTTSVFSQLNSLYSTLWHYES